jgi:hypothetical protein
MKKLRNLILLFSGITLAFWFNRRWDKRFISSTITPVNIIDELGNPQTGRKVRVQSIFNAAPEIVWQAVQTPDLWQRVTYPLLTFTPPPGMEMPELWQLGDQATFQLKGFGLIPAGNHTIQLESIDHDQMVLRSKESGSIASVWNHSVFVEPHGEGRTLYTDEIDFFAGALTPFVAAFAYFFYRYRQTNWQKIAPSL